MSPEDLTAWLGRRPYIPLRVHVTGGIHYDVLNPQFVVVGRTSVFIGLRRDIDSPYFDEPVMVAMQHIVRVEPMVELMQAAPAGG